ncbi:MAG: CDP-alcohol phosphatidyltransferase family protein [bacterium]
MYIWIYLVLRPLSYRPTRFLLKSGFSANQVTVISTIVGLIGCIFLILGGFVARICGFLLLNIWLLLDCVDGNIARLKKTSSSYGKFLDSLGGDMVSICVFLCIGFGIFRNPDSSLLLSSWKANDIFINKSIFLILGFASSACYLLSKLISLLNKSLFAESLKYDVISSPKNSNRLHSILWTISANLFGISGFFLPLFFLATILNLLGLFQILFLLVNFGVFAYIVKRIITKSIRMKTDIHLKKSAVLAVILGTAGCILLATGHYYTRISGIILIGLWVIIGHVKSDLLLFNNTLKRLDDIVITLSDYIISTFLFMSAAVGVYMKPGRSAALIFGVWASLTAILPRFILYKFSDICLHGDIEAFKRFIEDERTFLSVFLKICRKAASISGLVILILLIAAIFNSLEWFVVFYALLNSILFLFILFFSFRTKLKALNNL